MLVNLNKILPKARRQRYAVGAFNTSNLELTQAILKASEALRAPVIVATSEKAISYAGIENISEMVVGMARRAKVPVCLHLDHGASFEICRECIEHGYTSVMIDASHLPFKENVKLTAKVVRYAHKRNVSVEAEIGRLAGIEDDLAVKKEDALYTDPAEAKRFAEATKCDALAIAIGTSHGAHKFKDKAKLRIDILNEIARRVHIPLVLHGASAVKSSWINRVNRFGGKMEKARGVPDGLIAQAVKNGIAKINTDTDLRIGFTAGTRQYLAEHRADFDPRKFAGLAREYVEAIVTDRIEVFGSKGRA